MGSKVSYIITGLGGFLLLLAIIFAFTDSFQKGPGQSSLFAAAIMLLFAGALYIGGILLALKANFSEQVGQGAAVIAKNPELLTLLA